ncbi:hypothetical protein B0H10DRAFT_1993963 [Mycena sp. CBHHK59/15]|nr:hypothetical protein B0H10DRAFT_1993963 [Mycena sp. CBHHK59/15]
MASEANVGGDLKCNRVARSHWRGKLREFSRHGRGHRPSDVRPPPTSFRVAPWGMLSTTLARCRPCDNRRKATVWVRTARAEELTLQKRRKKWI